MIREKLVCFSLCMCEVRVYCKLRGGPSIMTEQAEKAGRQSQSQVPGPEVENSG